MLFVEEDAVNHLNRNRSRKSVLFLSILLSFLFQIGMAPAAHSAGEWPAWPKKTTPAPANSPEQAITETPVKEGAPSETKAAPAAPMSDAAANAGKAAGKSASAGISSGTLGWAAAIIGTGVLIGVAAGSGGGSTSNH